MAGTAALRAALDDAPDSGPIEAVLDADRNLNSDHDLITDCRAGKSEAWEALVSKYERLVYSIPLNCGLSADDAADIAQLTFTYLVQSLDDLDDDSCLLAWLATVARRHSWRLLSRRRREADNGLTAPAEPEPLKLVSGDSAVTIERWELVAWLEQGMSSLDGRCRDLLLSLYFDPGCKSYADVADLLTMPVGSVGPTRARCLERLRQALGEIPSGGLSADGCT